MRMNSIGGYMPTPILKKGKFLSPGKTSKMLLLKAPSHLPARPGREHFVMLRMNRPASAGIPAHNSGCRRGKMAEITIVYLVLNEIHCPAGTAF